ncbi:10261_t:CDS:1, partial [Acaulospora colombiana]
ALKEIFLVWEVLSLLKVNIPNPIISQCIAHASSTGTSSKLLEDDIPTSSDK